MTSTESRRRRTWRLGLLLVLSAASFLIFMLGNPYYSIFPTNRNPE